MSVNPSPAVILQQQKKEKWTAFIEAAEAKKISISSASAGARALFTAFTYSEFVSTACIRFPEMAANLVETGELNNPVKANAMSNQLRPILQSVLRKGSNDAMDPFLVLLKNALRTFRRREMVRIAVRDLAGTSSLDETMAELSSLASATLDGALSLLYERLCLIDGIPEDKHGRQQKLVVLGMGKLGAGELNFSSDVDLIFAYPAIGETRGGRRTQTNEVFFTKLCRYLIQAIGEKTADGFVFRVDTRLRPYGDGGPLVMNFDHLEDYYQFQGREWERYALIKATVTAGDREAGQFLLQRLRPFIYRRYLDFGVFESLRDMKRKIAAEVSQKRLEDNIKLGRGGIREIEFFGQMFQLIRGGVLPALQEPAIQIVLERLGHEEILPHSAVEELTAAYRFLRNTEHRLQEDQDRQTHALPTDPVACLQLAQSMGFETWQDYRIELDRHRSKVRYHFDRLLETDTDENKKKDAEDPLLTLWRTIGSTDVQVQILVKAGYEDGKSASALLEAFKAEPSTRALSGVGKSRLDRLIPQVLRAVGDCDNAEVVLDRVLILLKKIQQRVSYLSLLIEYPNALTHLIRLFGVSPWIATFLSRHPVLLDELLDPRTLYAPPDAQALKKSLDHQLAAVPDEDLEFQIETMCIFRQVNTLRVAASDITDVLPLMKVSDHLSWIAETILDKVVEISWNHLVKKHGRPSCSLDGEPCERGFAVIGYGKLGGIELGYASDLDLVFLHAADPGETKGGKNPIDNAYFFSRLGQRVVHMLSTHTPAGSLYETDMRLRPSGSSGLLVSHVDGFERYQMEEAWTWEHQALIRARPITGDAVIRNTFMRIRNDVLRQHRAPDKLKKTVRDMREKMRVSRYAIQTASFDIKEDRGAIVDIEFLVQYLVLQHAATYPEIIQWTDNVRLLQSLAKTSVLDPKMAYRLRWAYLIYRSVAHRLNLREQSTQVDLQRFKHLRDLVALFWEKTFGTEKKSPSRV